MAALFQSLRQMMRSLVVAVAPKSHRGVAGLRTGECSLLNVTPLSAHSHLPKWQNVKHKNAY